MQIKIKLISSFLVIAVIGGLIGYVGFIGINDVSNTFDVIAKDTVPELILLGEINTLSHEIQLEVVSYVLLVQLSVVDERLQEELDEYEEVSMKLSKVIAELEEHEEAEEEEEVEEKQFIVSMKESERRLHVAAITLIEKAHIVDQQTIITMKGDLELAELEIHELIETRIELEKEEFKIQDAITDKLSFTTSNFVITVGIIGFIFAISLGIFVSRTISMPISRLRDAAEAVNQGNFEVTINPHGDDETKDLIKSFNSMTVGLKRTRELEAEKLKNEKINALGTITSSLAHNLKNPLTVIKATTNILEATSDSVDEKTHQRLNLINTSIENMLNQIEDILDFVKQKPLDLKVASLDEILNIAISNIGPPERIKINLPENDIELKCDVEKIQVVFMNMITNSIEAIQGEGKITIDSSQNKRETIIEITDTGNVDLVAFEKMFDVLYTTKPTGTGLGLPYCKSVIEQHGGSIDVSKDPTKFIIILPRLD